MFDSRNIVARSTVTSSLNKLTCRSGPEVLASHLDFGHKGVGVSRVAIAVVIIILIVIGGVAAYELSATSSTTTTTNTSSSSILTSSSSTPSSSSSSSTSPSASSSSSSTPSSSSSQSSSPSASSSLTTSSSSSATGNSSGVLNVAFSDGGLSVDPPVRGRRPYFVLAIKEHLRRPSDMGYQRSPQRPDHHELSKFVPLLAKNWTESSDGKVWTFYLRTGVTFSNGDPFNALGRPLYGQQDADHGDGWGVLPRTSGYQR